MNLGIVIYSDDSETVWNAFRFGTFALSENDEVKVFLIGKGVMVESLDMDMFKVTEQLQRFVNSGGKIFACGTCLEVHQLEAPETFKVSKLGDLYEIVKESDRIVTF
ncbi:DsrE family protein [Chloroflexota bacterium]